MRSCTALLLLLFLRPATYAQDQPEASIPEIILADLSATYHQGGAFFSLPLRMDGRDVEHFVLFAASTAVFIGGDKSVMNAMHDIEHTEPLNSIMDIGTKYADTRYSLIIPTTLYIGGLVSGNDGIRKTGRQAFQALLYSSVVTQTFKFLVGRSRPHVVQDPYLAKPLTLNDNYNAMPSGHATVAFALSTVLSQNIDNIYASIGLYGLAVTTAVSRLYHNRHWMSDVFVGAVIGTATGVFVTSQDTEKTNGESSSPLKIIPGLTGIHLEYRF
jgi:hypothetical protein